MARVDLSYASLRTALGTLVLVLPCLSGPWTEPAHAREERGPAPTKKAFVTSTVGSHIFSTWAETASNGLVGADEICRARAQAGGIANHLDFVAWISDSTDDAFCRVHGLSGKRASNCGQGSPPSPAAGPWELVDGRPYLDTIDKALDDGAVYNYNFIKEDGTRVLFEFAENAQYFTGTLIDGAVDPGVTCNDWTSTDGSDGSLRVGRSSGTMDDWTYANAYACDFGAGAEARLLCVERGSGGPLTFPDHPGARVFVTSTNGPGDLGDWTTPDVPGTGIAAGDQICQELALDAALDHADTFQAILSDSSTNASQRIPSGGPFVRLDGTLVAQTVNELFGGRSRSSIHVDENGDFYSSFGSIDFVWTGSDYFGNVEANLHCADWTSTSGTGHVGRPQTGGTWMFDYIGSGCSQDRRLYCVSGDHIFGNSFESGNADAWN